MLSLSANTLRSRVYYLGHSHMTPHFFTFQVHWLSLSTPVCTEEPECFTVGPRPLKAVAANPLRAKHLIFKESCRRLTRNQRWSENPSRSQRRGPKWTIHNTLTQHARLQALEGMRVSCSRYLKEW